MLRLWKKNQNKTFGIKYVYRFSVYDFGAKAQLLILMRECFVNKLKYWFKSPSKVLKIVCEVGNINKIEKNAVISLFISN